jgi:Prenyltransferase and squalene oxidase repeat
MGRPGRTAAAVFVALTALIGFAGITAHSADPATQALNYLAGQQQSDGSLPGYSPAAVTEQYVMGAAKAGYDLSTLHNGAGATAMDYLAANASAATSDAGKSGEMIEAVVAAGDDPTNFGGTNLVSALSALYDSTTGAYGFGDTFTQSLALLGLEAAGREIPALAVTYLRNAQDSDSGWNYTGTVSDPTTCGAAFSCSDTNSTAMALLALDGAGDHSLDASALLWLKSQQESSGGFAYQESCYGFPPCADVDSTALVMQAIAATGQDPSAAGWTDGGDTPYAYLVSQQQADGGYVGYSGEDAFTTAQVPPALLLVKQAAPAPTPTPTSTPTATPTPQGNLAPPISTAAPTPTAAVAAAKSTGQTTTPVTTATPAPTPSDTAEATASPSPTGGVLGTTTGAGSIPPAADPSSGGGSGVSWLLYVLAALLGLGIVGVIAKFAKKPAF